MPFLGFSTGSIASCSGIKILTVSIAESIVAPNIKGTCAAEELAAKAPQRISASSGTPGSPISYNIDPSAIVLHLTAHNEL